VDVSTGTDGTAGGLSVSRAEPAVPPAAEVTAG